MDHVVRPFDLAGRRRGDRLGRRRRRRATRRPSSGRRTGRATLDEDSDVGAEGDEATLPDDLILRDGETVIVAEAVFRYTPWLLEIDPGDDCCGVWPTTGRGSARCAASIEAPSPPNGGSRLHPLIAPRSSLPRLRRGRGQDRRCKLVPPPPRPRGGATVLSSGSSRVCRARRMALRMRSSLCMQAVSATLAGLPASRSRGMEGADGGVAADGGDGGHVQRGADRRRGRPGCGAGRARVPLSRFTGATPTRAASLPAGRGGRARAARPAGWSPVHRADARDRGEQRRPRPARAGCCGPRRRGRRRARRWPGVEPGAGGRRGRGAARGARPLAADLLGGAHRDQLAAAGHQVDQRLPLGARAAGAARAGRRRRSGRSPRVQAVGLGQPAGGAGEVAHLARVDDGRPRRPAAASSAAARSCRPPVASSTTSVGRRSTSQAEQRGRGPRRRGRSPRRSPCRQDMDVEPRLATSMPTKTSPSAIPMAALPCRFGHAMRPGRLFGLGDETERSPSSPATSIRSRVGRDPLRPTASAQAWALRRPYTQGSGWGLLVHAHGALPEPGARGEREAALQLFRRQGAAAGALGQGDGEGVPAAGDRERGGDHGAGLAAAGDDAAGEKRQALAAGLAPAAGGRIQGAQAALDRPGGLGEVEAALVAGDLAGVGDAGLGLGDGFAACRRRGRPRRRAASRRRAGPGARAARGRWRRGRSAAGASRAPGRCRGPPPCGRR